ncbi:sine oculis-binding protein homolog A-like isoform X2 [Mya arenaria]|uniref:sine oculis-binding protein homolog A-like isoform X2 n=2 Tax=Mya arenaria TaxID=6604 RepID=UPI0022DE9799|nr:sine oculis-binding protein homolog A-like isoform X2 [Mya arenaria]
MNTSISVLKLFGQRSLWVKLFDCLSYGIINLNYAEHTMNELLGLFGYDDKVNSTDTENLHLENYADNKEDASDVIKNVISDKRKSSARLRSRLRHRLYPAVDHQPTEPRMSLPSPLKHREPEAEDTESEPPREEEGVTGPQCAWCRKLGAKQVTLDTPTGVKEFCSEVCFNQCRRASFKKSKICDWCKHVRHTVNYVEFKDGETQLQFCSEKCLNQYKMSLFCKETQELSGTMDKSDSTGEGGEGNSHREKILITPELWSEGDNASRAAEARQRARARERAERDANMVERIRIADDQSLDLSTKSRSSRTDSSTERVKMYPIERVKQEPVQRNKRIHVPKESERRSPNRQETKSTTPASHASSLPPHMMHPMLAGLSPWLHQAHLLGALPPGLGPYGQLHPMMLGGLLPPSQSSSGTQELPSHELDDHGQNKYVLRNDTTANHSKLSPRSETSSVPVSLSPSRDQRHSPAASVDRRTSSLFPVDFPHLFASGALQPPPQFQGPSPVPRVPAPIPGVPPVTMMVPFPVILPVPVPIPVPIPFTVKQLATMFGHKIDSDDKQELTVNTNNNTPDEKRSPLPPLVHSPQSVISTSSDASYVDKYQVRTGSRNSLPDMTYAHHATRATRSESRLLKRSLTPESLDLSRTSKIPRYDYSSFTSDDDGVIDLSASRENGHKSDDTCSETGAINGHARDESSSVDDNKDEILGEDGVALPKIHIITHRDETPLNAPLPLPPTENPYSSRRGLILDAPAIPKKTRSPSPERRVYVRNVPRDIIEAARRRCHIRTRIRTK